jgi:UDPglucose--hexose-1-phosphate uridylyltransferase
MSQLRKDLISGRWVIIASERSKRPDDFRPPREETKQAAEQKMFCPFCEGSESKTPPEVFSFRKKGAQADQPGWQVRVVPNKFPALDRGLPPPKPQKGLFQSMPGVGVHEVVIENPDHNRELNDLSVSNIKEVLLAFKQRIENIEGELHYQYVQIFKNKGKDAGASLSHPHSQIIATPIVPKRIKEELYGAERLYGQYKGCVFCRMIEEDLNKCRDRLVFQNRHFVVVAPFASRFPFEMAIYPFRHSPHFSSQGPEEIISLAHVLKEVLTRLGILLSNPPYNFIIHQAPNLNLSKTKWPRVDKSYHWHMEITPVLTRVAGFELGTGFYINPVPPEVAAKYLHGCRLPRP